MSTPENEQLEQRFFELVCYMVTSARNLIPEPKRYGPQRLVESVSRLIDIVRDLGLMSPRLQAIQNQIQEGFLQSIIEGDERFAGFLEDLVMALVPLMDQREKER
jgi:hypothetical protein